MVHLRSQTTVGTTNLFSTNIGREKHIMYKDSIIVLIITVQQVIACYHNLFDNDFLVNTLMEISYPVTTQVAIATYHNVYVLPGKTVSIFHTYVASHNYSHSNRHSRKG